MRRGRLRRRRTCCTTSASVSDIDRSLAFWCDALGCTLLVRQGEAGRVLRGAHRRTRCAHPSGTSAVVGLTHPIVLLQYLTPRHEAVHSTLSAPGASHIALMFHDVEDVLGRVLTHGGDAISAPVVVDSGENAGMSAVYVRDSDGTSSS